MIHLANPFFGLMATLFFAAIVLWRFVWRSSVVYSYPLTSFLASISAGSLWRVNIVRLLRLGSLLSLLVLVWQPQFYQHKTTISVDGIDIAMVVDVSGSMEAYDDPKDLRCRLDVVKAEAARFVEQRVNDKIALVVFAGDALALSPLTMDKIALKQAIKDINLRIFQDTSTAIGKGLAAGILRLKNSEAKSKVIIFLTDGCSSAKDDFPVDKAIAYARELDVKIYTIGVGSMRPFCMQNGLRFPLNVASTACMVDQELLRKIATQTGGVFFYAHTPGEVEKIYAKIDALEKKQINDVQYFLYFNIFWPIVVLLIVCLSLEIILTGFFWRALRW